MPCTLDGDDHLRLHVTTRATANREAPVIEIFSSARDNVIKSSVATARTRYDHALSNLFPLLDRFGEQRKTQNKKFYSRLRTDIVGGCIMPPITLAFVSKKFSLEQETAKIESFVNENIKEGYILDGMQRLNTLHDASSDTKFDKTRPIYINIIIAERYDLLLYRMITLNNGQKPMTARHQVEMLTKGVIDLSDLSIQVVTEKETEGTKIHGAFKKSDIVEAYTAFLTDSVNNQNSKIIETKLDELIVGKVMESNISDSNVNFTDILHEVDRICSSQRAKEWLRQVNNLIGFTVGAKKSLALISSINLERIDEAIQIFEDGFDAINKSKVNVGKSRRELSAYFFENIDSFVDADVADVEAAFFDKTMVD